MNDKAEKVLVLESDDSLKEHIVAVWEVASETLKPRRNRSAKRA